MITVATRFQQKFMPLSTKTTSHAVGQIAATTRFQVQPPFGNGDVIFFGALPRRACFSIVEVVEIYGMGGLQQQGGQKQ